MSAGAHSQLLILALFSGLLLLSVVSEKITLSRLSFIFAVGFTAMYITRGTMIVSLPLFLIVIGAICQNARIKTVVSVAGATIFLMILVLIILPDRSVLDINNGMSPLVQALREIGVVDKLGLSNREFFEANNLKRQIPVMKTYFLDPWYYKWLVQELLRNPYALVFLSTSFVVAGVFFTFVFFWRNKNLLILILSGGYLYLTVGHYLVALSFGTSLIVLYSVFFYSSAVIAIASGFSGLLSYFHSRFKWRIFTAGLACWLFVTLPPLYHLASGAKRDLTEFKSLVHFFEEKESDEEILYIGLDRKIPVALSHAGHEVSLISLVPEYSKILSASPISHDSSLYHEIYKRRFWTDLHLESWIKKDYAVVVIANDNLEHQNLDVFPKNILDLIDDYFICEPLTLSTGSSSVRWCLRKNKKAEIDLEITKIKKIISSHSPLFRYT